jgi:hypothetical protein
MNSDTHSLEEKFLDEMVRGYLDGRNPDNPEPSQNRSRSYAHGFANGRDALFRSPRALAQTLREMADAAIAEDIATELGGLSAPTAPRIDASKA